MNQVGFQSTNVNGSSEKPYYTKVDMYDLPESTICLELGGSSWDPFQWQVAHLWYERDPEENIENTSIFFLLSQYLIIHCSST